MAKQTARIKIDPITKESLDELKTDVDWTYSSVISTLIREHDKHTIVMVEKEKKLREEYVERPEYNRLYEENIGNRERVKELTDKLESKLGEIKDKEKGFADEIKKQHDVYVNLQGVLSIKEGELQDAHEENKDLKDAMDELKDKQSNNLSIIQTQCNDFRARYNNLRDHVDRACIRIDTIKTLYQIVWFLFRHKHSFFTIEQLTDKIGYKIRDEIAEALVLSSYKIFPVRKYLIKDVECFGFDRRYLK